MNKSDKDVAERLLSTTIENISRCMFDDFLMANAEATAKSGRNATITREEIAECCKWCKGLAGKYKYGTEPKDVYRRHDNCKCLVLFKREGEKFEDAHTKQRFEDEKSARLAKLDSINESDNTESITARVRNTYQALELERDTEKDIMKQKSSSLKKGIRSLQKMIEKHFEYIGNPRSHAPEWDSWTKKRQEGLVRHWMKEIKTAETSIEKRKRELQRRGEMYE